jgi:hypothetical protein
VKKVVKVTMCLKGRTIKVPKNQVAKYRKRGAKLGACKVTLCYRGRTIKVAKTQVTKLRKKGAKPGACKKPRRRR